LRLGVTLFNDGIISIANHMYRYRQEIRNDRTGEQVFLHDVLISGPIFSNSSSIAKNMAAQRAYMILQDETHKRHLKSVCNCVLGKPETTETLTEQLQDIVLDESEEKFVVELLLDVAE
jgi:3-deoxy-D-manno-octulosonic-acid transferase